MVEHNKGLKAPGELDLGSYLRVRVELPVSDWYRATSETLWAAAVAVGHYELRNIPFYASALAFGDVVAASQRPEGLTMSSVVRRSGHSTYRIFVTDTVKLLSFESYWEPLEQLGCTFERATARLIAVDVPPECDVYEAYDQLAKGEAAGVWEFQEGHVGHRLM